MPLDELKRKLQGFFTDGLVTIVGSGLSCAEGLPGMYDLAQVLSKRVPSECDSSDLDTWGKINEQLATGVGLETAINNFPPSPSLELIIVQIVAQTVKQYESEVISDCLSKGRELKFSTLLPRSHDNHDDSDESEVCPESVADDLKPPFEIRSCEIPDYILRDEQDLLKKTNSHDLHDALNKVYAYFNSIAHLMQQYAAEEEMSGVIVNDLAEVLSVSLD